jgi:hypothetical protein
VLSCQRVAYRWQCWCCWWMRCHDWHQHKRIRYRLRQHLPRQDLNDTGVHWVQLSESLVRAHLCGIGLLMR